MKVQVTTIEQTANEVLGKKAETLRYLVLGEGENQITINIGQKSYDKVKKALDEEAKKGGKK